MKIDTFVYKTVAHVIVISVWGLGCMQCILGSEPLTLLCHRQNQGGKLAVLGSCHMFSDQYLDKEENSKIMVSFSLSSH